MSHLKVRVYYSDTDCGGVVYYANYLKYMEAGRMEFFREKGLELADFHRQGFLFAIVETNIKYRASAKLSDILDVETTLDECSGVTLTFLTKIFNQNGTLLIVAETKAACINNQGKLQRIPLEIADKISSK